MTYHRSSSILLLHQLKAGRKNALIRAHIHQILCSYGLYTGTDGTSWLVFT